MITREEALDMIKRADSVMRKFTEEAAKGQDVLKAVYAYLMLTRQAEEWREKLADIRQRDWEEYINSPEYIGDASRRGDWWQ